MLRTFLAVLWGLSASGLAGSGPSPAGRELVLEPYMGRLRQIQVRIGAEIHPFLFDTGGGLTLVDPDLVRLLGCRPHGRLTGFRMSGERVVFESCGPGTLQVGGTAVVQEIAVFDLMALLPAEWPPLLGVLSLHTFQDRALTLDLARNRLILETDRTLKERVGSMREVRLHVERDMEGRGVAVYLEARAGTGHLRLLVDSGNLAGFILAPHALEQLGLDLPAPGARGESGLPEVTLDLVGLGPVTTPILVQDVIHDGVVSAAFLESLVLTLDLREGRAWGRIR